MGKSNKRSKKLEKDKKKNDEKLAKANKREKNAQPAAAPADGAAAPAADAAASGAQEAEQNNMNIICKADTISNAFSSPLTTIVADPDNVPYHLTTWAHQDDNQMKVSDNVLWWNDAKELPAERMGEALAVNALTPPLKTKALRVACSFDSLVCAFVSNQAIVVIAHDPNALTAHLTRSTLPAPKAAHKAGKFSRVDVWRHTVTSTLVAACDTTTPDVNLWRYEFGGDLVDVGTLKVPAEYGNASGVAFVHKSASPLSYCATVDEDVPAYVLVGTAGGYLLTFSSNMSGNAAPVFVLQDQTRPTHEVTCISYAHSGRRVVVGTTKSICFYTVENDGSLKRFAVSEALYTFDKASGTMKEEELGHVQALGIASDCSFVLSGQANGIARVWSVSDGAYVRSFRCGGDTTRYVRSVSVSHDNRLVAVAVAGTHSVVFDLLDALQNQDDSTAPSTLVTVQGDAWDQHLITFRDVYAHLRASPAAFYKLWDEAESRVTGHAEDDAAANEDDDVVGGHMTELKTENHDKVPFHSVVLKARSLEALTLPACDDSSLCMKAIRAFIYTDLGHLYAVFGDLCDACDLNGTEDGVGDTDAAVEAAKDFGCQLAQLICFAARNRASGFGKLLMECNEYVGGLLLHSEATETHSKAQSCALWILAGMLVRSTADESDVNVKAILDAIASQCQHRLGSVEDAPGSLREIVGDNAFSKLFYVAGQLSGKREAGQLQRTAPTIHRCTYTPLASSVVELFDSGRTATANEPLLAFKVKQEAEAFHRDILRDRDFNVEQKFDADVSPLRAFTQCMRFVYTRSFANVTQDDARYVEPVVRQYLLSEEDKVGQWRGKLAEDERLLVDWCNVRASILSADVTLMHLYMEQIGLKERGKTYNAELLSSVMRIIATHLWVNALGEAFAEMAMAAVTDAKMAQRLQPLMAAVQVAAAKRDKEKETK